MPLYYEYEVPKSFSSSVVEPVGVSATSKTIIKPIAVSSGVSGAAGIPGIHDPVRVDFSSGSPLPPPSPPVTITPPRSVPPISATNNSTDVSPL